MYSITSYPSFNVLILLLYRTICNIFLQFNVLRLANNVLISWCWLLLLLLASYCQRVALLTIGFLPHSTVVYHSTNQCSGDKCNSTGDNCCNNVAGGTWALHTVIWVKRKYSMRHKYWLPLYWGKKVVLVVSYLSWVLDSGNHVVLTWSSGRRSGCKYLRECWCGSRCGSGATGDTCWVRGPLTITPTHCCHLSLWDKPWVTLEHHHWTFCCVGVRLHRSIDWRGWSSTVSCRIP